MKQISSLELNFLLKEFEILKDSRVDNIYNVGKESFIFQFHKSNVGKFMLKVIIGKAIFLTENKEIDEAPSNFCQLLRKHLGGKFFVGIKQIDPERILEFVFKSKEETKKIYFEFFGSGNVVLCNEDSIIINALNIHKFKDRNIAPKEKYDYPKSPYNFFNISWNDLKNVFKNSKKDKLVTSLAIEIGLGGIYSEEICLLSDIDKNINSKIINEKSIKKIQQSIKKIVDKKIASDLRVSLTHISHKSQAIFLDNKLIDAVPFDLLFYKNFQKRDFENFSAALDFYYSNIVEEKKSASEIRIDGIKRIIEGQIAALEQLKKEGTEYREKGELIYHKYQLINEIITEINKAAQKYPWQEIKEKLKGHKIIKEINLRDKTIMIEI